MIIGALFFLGFALLLGVTMVVLHGHGRIIPFPLATGHGAFAAAGLVLLAFAVVRSPSGSVPLVCLVLLAAVAAAGLFLYRSYWWSRRLPLRLLLLHALSGLTGFLLLLGYALAGSA